MVEHKNKIRVRYSETDQMGVVYYGNYAAYFEVARVEFLRAHGMVYKKLEDEGIIMPVVHYSNDYRFPAKYDDELTVTTTVDKEPSTTITFNHSVENQDGKLICTAKVILVFLDKESFRPRRVPESIQKIIREKLVN